MALAEDCGHWLAFLLVLLDVKHTGIIRHVTI